jgi:hypothetical protein
MTSSKLTITAGLAAAVFGFCGPPASGAGHAGAGLSGGGGGGHGSSAGGHASSGARGSSGSAAGRHGLPGYAGIRAYGRSAITGNNVSGWRTSTGQHQLNRDRQIRAATGARRNFTNHSGLDPQTAQRLRNWQGTSLDTVAARQCHREWCHDHHHGQNWWRRHCDVIVLADWGWWGWFNGWWFPAWGYDPYYSDYAYDGPIYGYGGLPPDEAIANVQAELQRLGYYSYAVDGKLGPLTQSAISRYQRDHRLPITGTIDPATVRSFGLVGE